MKIYGFRRYLKIPDYMHNSQYYRNNENLSFAMTTKEQEADMFRAARLGDTQVWEHLVSNHLLYCANYGRQRVKGKLPDDEVVSACNEALMKAMKGFDPERGIRFTSYLKPFLRGAIAELWLSKNIVKMDPAKKGVEASETRFTSLPEEGGLIPAEFQNRDVTPFDDLQAVDDKVFLISMLEELKQKLAPKDRALLTEVYTKGKKFAQIARERKVSREAVGAAHARIMQKLRKLIKDNEHPRA